MSGRSSASQRNRCLGARHRHAMVGFVARRLIGNRIAEDRHAVVLVVLGGNASRIGRGDQHLVSRRPAVAGTDPRHTLRFRRRCRESTSRAGARSSRFVGRAGARVPIRRAEVADPIDDVEPKEANSSRGAAQAARSGTDGTRRASPVKKVRLGAVQHCLTKRALRRVQHLPGSGPRVGGTEDAGIGELLVGVHPVIEEVAGNEQDILGRAGVNPKQIVVRDAGFRKSTEPRKTSVRNSAEAGPCWKSPKPRNSRS